MEQLSKPSPKTFNLLSIGQRGVGKTVFLAGSYNQVQENSAAKPKAALKPAPTPKEQRQLVWFECQDQDMQKNLDKILHHVERTGSYPPATIKVTSFNFRLKQHSIRGVRTLCDFRWSDIPGEACDLRNSEFQDIVLTSHGCCVFINAYLLLHDPNYVATVQSIFNQVIAIASLTYQHRLNYAIALILTQCDRLPPGAATQLQLEEALQPLTMRLDDIRATYKRFYSGIPIQAIDGVPKLSGIGAADPLLWLLSTLNKYHRARQERNLASSLNGAKPPIVSRQHHQSIVLVAITTISLLGMLVSVLLALGLFDFTPHPTPQQQEQTTP